MVSIKEYAKSNGVSYEAVRKQVTRYKTELRGHITKVNRTQYLDEEAVKFLNEKRADNPIVILQTEDKERIEQLESENKALLIKIGELQDELLRERSEVKQLQQAKIELLEQKQEVKTKGFWEKLFGKGE